MSDTVIVTQAARDLIMRLQARYVRSSSCSRGDAVMAAPRSVCRMATCYLVLTICCLALLLVVRSISIESNTNVGASRSS